MRNTRTLIYGIIVTVLILIGVSVYYYIKGYVPKYRWFEKLSSKYDQPYGLKLMYELLSDTKGKYKFVDLKKNLIERIDTTDTTALYVFIGNRIMLNSENSNTLLDFVYKGNVVFISTISGEHDFFSAITDDEYPSVTCDYDYDTTMCTTVIGAKPDSVFCFSHKFNKSLTNYYWYGVDSVVFADTLANYGFKPISYIKGGLVDCYSAPLGKGLLIHHSNPIFFSNFYLSEIKGLNYVNSIFPKQKFTKIYWDEVSKSASGDSDEMSKESLFRFIFSENSLKWSWYFILGTVLLFLLVNSKRRLPKIPQIPENKNSTVEYVYTIGHLHYQNNTILFTSSEMMKQFYSFIKHKYNISQHSDSEIYKKIVAPKSGISMQQLEEIFKYYREIKYNNPPDKQSLIGLYNSIEYFYKNCK